MLAWQKNFIFAEAPTKILVFLSGGNKILSRHEFAISKEGVLRFEYNTLETETEEQYKYCFIHYSNKKEFKTDASLYKQTPIRKIYTPGAGRRKIVYILSEEK